MSVYLRLLGGARIEAAGEVVTGRAAHRRRLGLLALLALSPSGRLARERIIYYLWPDQSSEGGRRLLSEALHVIRRELGEETIAAAGDELLLNPTAVGSDVAEFIAAITSSDWDGAVRLYTGPFLDGWFVREAPEFEEWAEAQRRHLAQDYARAVEALAQARERVNDYATATRYWRLLVTLDPESSRFALGLSRSMRASGEVAAALRVLLDHTKYMEAEELPVDPALTRYAQQLRNGTAGDESRRRLGSQPSEAEGAPSVADAGTSDHPPASIQPAAHSSANGDEVHSLPADAQPAAGSVTPGRRHLRALPFVAAGAIVVLLGAGVFAVHALRGRAEAASASVPLDLNPNRVAVLYFDEQTDGVGYLADGLTETLIDELSSVGALHVVPRSGVKPFRGQTPAPRLDSIAALLGAGTLVEGSVQREGDSVRVTVGVIDARSGTLVGSTTLERPLRGLFAIEDDVAGQVSTFLRKRLGDELSEPLLLRASRTGTNNEHAQELLMRAERARKDAAGLRVSGTADDLHDARKKLAAADSLLAICETLDPRWIMPTIMRGWIATDVAMLQTGTERVASLTAALPYAERALRRDSTSAAALELRGTVRWKLALSDVDATRRSGLIASAETDLQRAVDRDSTLASAAATLSQLLRATRTDRAGLVRALAYARQAYQADAYLAYARDIVSQLYRGTMSLGQADSARAWCARGHQIAPDDWTFVECELTIMRLDLAHAAPARAWQVVAKTDSLDPPDKARAAGHAYNPIYRRLVAAAVSARAGQKDTARAVLAWALRTAQPDPAMRTDVKHDVAFLRLALGERDAAFAVLAEYLSAQPQFYALVLNDPSFRQFGLDSARLARALSATGSGPRGNP